jgi:hypothetical protein
MYIWKENIREQGIPLQTDLSGSVLDILVGSCEYGKETLSSTKCEEFLH